MANAEDLPKDQSSGHHGTSLLPRLSQSPSIGAASDQDDSNSILESRTRHWSKNSLRKPSFSSSVNDKTPARSFFHRPSHDAGPGPDIAQNATRSVRAETAQLASRALSDIDAKHLSRSIPQNPIVDARKAGFNPAAETQASAAVRSDWSRDTHFDSPSLNEAANLHRAGATHSSSSALTAMMQSPPSASTTESPSSSSEDLMQGTGVRPVTIREAVISQPGGETAALLKRSLSDDGRRKSYGTTRDIESQNKDKAGKTWNMVSVWHGLGRGMAQTKRLLGSPKSWNRGAIWNVVKRPVGYVPPVILGLLLNILDALSYGMILFPLGEPLFSHLGPDGISIFYVSCIVSQLVYSLGGSVFKGGVGSEMIEVVPFFHTMAFSILHQIGEDKPTAVLATTILAYSISSVLTGVVFFLMGQCKLGALIGFFPRHILIGCIGGVGWFLVATGFEVTARLDGSLEYNMETLRRLVKPDTLALWIIPLVLAITLTTAKRWVHHPLTDAIFFLAIIAIFYYFVLAIPDLDLSELRDRGWVFEAPPAGVPFYHFYTLFDFRAVDWLALSRTIPAMLALTFFGILHVPINIPALGMSLSEDNVDIDRELKAHGISNALSGFCGSIQNYLVYTNSLLVIRSGGNSRVAGVLLAMATFGVLIAGPVLIGYIPIMVVGSLIFFLGIDLMREALVDTWGKVQRLEYFTIIIIIVTMGAWDFVYGILVGILLACVSFVLQTSQVSAIRGKLYGGVANSTVRRHPVQRRFLHDAGQQIHVMKLAGYLFFGTIVGVEKNIRILLEESFQQKPIRYLVLDLFNVDGVDFSAAEAFTRINRLLQAKNVQLVICGIMVDGEIRKSLRNIGLFDEEDGVQHFVSLNSALEHCENELLKSLYQHRDGHVSPGPVAPFLDVPKPPQSLSADSFGLTFSSPRQHHLREVATTTLSEHQPSSSAQWQDYRQPLRLIVQTFSTVSAKSEEFWYPTERFFRRVQISVGGVLFRHGDSSEGFYLLESGILKANYEMPQGHYSELIVAGTTCGELPFFSDTPRTATVMAEQDCIAWMLDRDGWATLQQEMPRVAQELLTISLKLTSERMDVVTKYMLLTSG